MYPAKVKTRYGTKLGYPSIPGVRQARQLPKTDFRFVVVRPHGHTIVPRDIKPQTEIDQEQYVINGRQVNSKPEWHLYRALIMMGAPAWSIRYQVPWHGGRVLGGQLLDFLIDVGGTPMVIRVQGHHWHPTEYGSPLDTFTRYQMLSEGLIVHDIPDTRLQSIEDAIAEVTRLNIL